MDTTKSSYWGGVSYIGLSEDRETIRIRVAGRDVVVQMDDPGCTKLSITNRNKKVFLVLDGGDTVKKIWGIILDPKDMQAFHLQRSLQEGVPLGEIYKLSSWNYHRYKKRKK
jgi:hypothetical protein